MKQPKISELKVDRAGTRRIRADALRVKKIKITINIDESSLVALRSMSVKTGSSYQKLLNLILKEGLGKRAESESRLDRIEKELASLKRKIAA